jgi:hypothetical protein
MSGQNSFAGQNRFLTGSLLAVERALSGKYALWDKHFLLLFANVLNTKLLLVLSSSSV